MTTNGADRLRHPVPQLVDAVACALDEAGDPLLAGLTDGELDRALIGMEALISRLRVRQLALVSEARARNRAGLGGAACHARWLALLLAADTRDAARRAHEAAVLDAAAAEPVTAGLVEDVRDGSALLPQTVIAARALADLPRDVPTAGRVAAAGMMRQAARDLDPERLARVGARLIEVADPDGADARLAGLLERQDRHAHECRSFWLGRPVDGMVKGRLILPTAEADMVRAAIESLAAPRTGTAEQPGAAGTDGAGVAGVADNNPWARAPAPDTTASDPRTPTQRRADAFTDLVARALAADLPDTGGHRPGLYLTIDVDRLRTEHPGRTLDGAPVAPSVLRRTACDAGIIPRCSGVGGPAVGRRTRHPHRAHRYPPGAHPARPWLQLPRLRPPTGVDRRPPHPPLGRRRPDQPGQPRPAVPPSPPRHPPPALDRHHRIRRAPLLATPWIAAPGTVLTNVRCQRPGPDAVAARSRSAW